MRRSEVNKCPERARKRAASDLRCAVRKLGLAEALRSLAGLAVELCPDRPVAAELARLAGGLAVKGGERDA